MNLDEAVGKIINKLKETGKFDKTLFVVYGDHEAYYQLLSRNITDLKNKYDPSLYKTTLFFSNPELKKVYQVMTGKNTFDSFTSPYVIFPTVLELLGYDYDEQLTYSPSIFNFESEYDGIFYSSELNAFFTDKTYSSDSFSFDYKLDILTEEELKFIAKLQNDKLQRLVYINEYYKNHMEYVE